MNWIDEYKFHLKITRSRSTKIGDYSHPYKGKPHRITVNNDLNKYSFLITLVHEIAHLTVWNKYGGKVYPHGAEWKKEFREHLEIFFTMNIFPGDVIESLNRYSSNPKASSCADTNLTKVLKRYDMVNEFIHLEELGESAVFTLKNGRTFVKGPQSRKRYLCTEVTSKRKYLVSPVAEVLPASLF